MRIRRLYPALIAAVCAALLAGCVSTPGAASAPSDPYSGAGLRYGLAPQPNQGVTFQKNVVLVQGGGASVRGVTSDGLTWTLSPDAQGIGELAPGRVMFLTDRAVGIVRGIHTTSAGVMVTIVPAALTDVIRDGDLASKKPVPLDKPIVESAQGAFWNDPALQQQAGVDDATAAGVPANPAAYTTGVPAAPSIPRPPAVPAAVSNAVATKSGAYDLKGGCCKAGVGTDFKYDNNGLKMSGYVKLAMSSPTAMFHVDISDAKFKSAALVVQGAGSISAGLHAYTEANKLIAGYSPPLAAGFAFRVPLGEYFGVPLSMVVNQTFTLRLDIPGSATLDAEGRVNLGAILAFSYANGKFHNGSTGTFDPSFGLHATNSLAVGISYAVFDYTVRMTIGFGALGFVVGVYVALAAHLVGAVGAPIGYNIDAGAHEPIEHCRLVQGSLAVDYGIGYSIPSFVAKVINFGLKLFNKKPIKTSDGKSFGWHRLATGTSVDPKSGLCTQKK